MSDVVEQGQLDRAGPPRWLRGGSIAVVVAVGVAVVARSHLLSADAPAPAPRQAATPGAPRTVPVSDGANVSQGISLVVRKGNQLKRYVAGSGVQPLATLPAGSTDPALVYSPRRNGSGTLVGVDRGVLLRASPVRGHTVTPIGRAQRVVGVSTRPSRVFVLQGGAAHHRSRLVEVDARTGHLTDDRPFPGYDAAGQWRPAGVVSSQDASALVLTRAAPGGRLDLALARDANSVRSPGSAAFRRIGSASRLLGVAAGGQILTVEDRPDTCIDRGCPITVLTVTGGRVDTRVVRPPSGWTYRASVGGDTSGDPFVLVARVGEPARLALAWLSGTEGVLIAGTDGLASSVAPVAGPDGSVFFAVPSSDGLRLSVWLPGSVSAALLIDQPALQPGSRLICGCR